ncbi:hypothetical protein LHL20_20790 [Alteromonas sp. McT4-15]|uniref:hypothetical protein n=1 Tax=Alteromonas sp. McT4-15 TaxID=2881256 RepID=UPI001CF8AE2B|nr:hypothetical protein [Alteromonas sp. McT4-15]MCB4438660.1 hypothetical protein [Alteromonas sp. McT4-15]
MLNLTGQLINIFKQPKREKDGKEYGGQDKIQVLGEVELPDGDKRMDMFTLTTRDIKNFEPYLGQVITFTIGVFATGKSVSFFIPQGVSPVSKA